MVEVTGGYNRNSEIRRGGGTGLASISKCAKELVSFEGHVQRTPHSTNHILHSHPSHQRNVVGTVSDKIAHNEGKFEARSLGDENIGCELRNSTFDSSGIVALIACAV